jgi:hypothetical protein
LPSSRRTRSNKDTRRVPVAEASPADRQSSSSLDERIAATRAEGIAYDNPRTAEPAALRRFMTLPSRAVRDGTLPACG